MQVPSSKNQPTRGSRGRSHEQLWRGTRSLIGVFAIAIAAVGCGSGDSASDDQDTVVLYGSTSMEPLFKGGIGDRLKEEGIAVHQSPLLVAQALTKSIAERKNPKASVVIVDTANFVKGMNAGLWETIDPAAVPGVETLPESIALDKFDNQGVPIYGMTLSFSYRKDLLDKNKIAYPESWSDLSNPQLKGRVGLMSLTASSGTYQLLAMAHANGGDDGDIEAGFKFVEKLKEDGQVGVIGQKTSSLNEALQRGDTWVNIQASHAAAVYTNLEPNIGYSYPSEGSPVDFNLAVIPKNAPNKAGAEKVISEILSDASQSQLGKEIYGIPVIANAENSDIAPGEEEIANGRLAFGPLIENTTAWLMDWESAAANHDEWYERWMASVEIG